MDIQSIFYFLGSVFIILNITILIGLIIVLVKAYKAVKETHRTVQNTVENLPERIVEMISSKPSLLAGTIGMGLSTIVMRKFKDFFKKK